MKRAVVTTLVTVTGLVLLLSFKSHATAAKVPTVIAGGQDQAAASGSPLDQAAASPIPSATPTHRRHHHATPAATPAASQPRATPSKTPSPSPASVSKTVTGDTVQTQYGPVQVQVTVRSGTITHAVAIQYPSQQPLDQQINSYAIPQLEQETVAAGSAHIDMVSGATYTSEGYIASLQSALNKLG